MKVQIGFSVATNWNSRLILALTGGNVSHTFLLLDTDDFGKMVLEETGTGWSLRTYAQFLAGKTKIVKVIDPPVSLNAALPTTLNWLGERYNYTGLIGMAWVCIGRWLGRKWRNPLRSNNSMFCSEALVYVLQTAGWAPVKDLDPESVDPQELEQILLAAGTQ